MTGASSTIHVVQTQMGTTMQPSTHHTDLETTKLTNLKVHGGSPDRQKHLTRSSSSNSSPDSPLDNDPFDSDDEKSSLDSFSPWAHKPNINPKPSADMRIGGSQNTKDENSSPALTEVPCNQAMERVGSARRPCQVQIQIPPPVFAQPSNWSVDESLFSIHDHHLYWRSGESSMSTAGHIFTYSTTGQPRCAAAMRSRELAGLAEATMKEVIQESESHQHYVATLAAETTTSSRRSTGATTKSFAFSIKAADSPKDGSSRTHGSVRSISPEERMPCQQPTVVTKATNESADQQPPAKSDPRAYPARPARSRWSSCIPCCSIW